MLKVSEDAHKSPLNDDELTNIFNEIDDDGNGYIDPKKPKAKKAFKKLAEKFNISRVSKEIFFNEFFQTKIFGDRIKWMSGLKQRITIPMERSLWKNSNWVLLAQL